MKTIYTTAFLFGISALGATAKEASTLPLINSEERPVIDGEVSKQEWSRALTIDLNLVNSPWDNAQSPVKTTTKIMGDDKHLYLLFIAEDPEPEKIQAMLGGHDGRWKDDLVGIKIDPYRTGHRNYEFLANPLGVKHDAIFDEVTVTQNKAWDGFWDAQGQINNKGYVVEMVIPYEILSFDGSSDIKTWNYELVRLYQREEKLRISHIPFDKDNACYACQMHTLSNIKAKTSERNLMITPSLSASQDNARNLYNDNGWDKERTFEAGVDIQWAPTTNTQIDATINPDFSTIELDALQLSANKRHSLYYEEKRTFFLTNADYFSTPMDIIYTRNIADPTLGLKISHKQNAHTFGAFVSEDEETLVLSPSNLWSSRSSFEGKSKAFAGRYRYDHNENTSFGFVSTARSGEQYHNYVAGVDAKHRFDDSNSVTFQLLSSEQKTPDDGDKISGDAYRIDFSHYSEFWGFSVSRDEIEKDFRADLGYIVETDIIKNSAFVDRLFRLEGSITELGVLAGVDYNTDMRGNLLKREHHVGAYLFGPKQLYAELLKYNSDNIGLFPQTESEDSLNLETYPIFEEDYWSFYAKMQPTHQHEVSLYSVIGDKIDYENNRLADYREISPSISWAINRHAELKWSYIFNDMKDSDGWIYRANITDVRFNYQYDANHALRITLGHQDYRYNDSNNPFAFYLQNEKSLFGQLLYRYQLNPRTAFYLGYSEGHLTPEEKQRLVKNQQSWFSKLSYAW